MTRPCLLRTILGLTLAILVGQPARADKPPAADPAAAAVNVAVPRDYVSTVLANGLRVSILPVATAATVVTQLVYHVGLVDESKDELGLAHLFEHLMFGATTAYPKYEYEQFIYRHGGAHNAYTASDETVYWSEVPPAQHAQILQMEAERMVHLLISPTDFDIEKRIVSEELRLRQENSQINRLAVKLIHAALNGHPYDHTAGTPATIASATIERARAFYARHYRPENAHLVVVGAVDPVLTLAAVVRYFGPVIKGKDEPKVAQAPSLVGWPLSREVELAQDILPGKAAALAYPLPAADAPDYWALQVMAQLLRGQRNPVREDLVRRQRMAFEAGLEYFQWRRGGALFLWAAYLPYRRKTTAFRVLEQARDRLSNQSWLTESSLRAAKRTLLRKDYRSSYSLSGRATAIGTAHHWHGDERLAFTEAAQLSAVTAAQVRAVYQRYVLAQTPVRLYLKPEKVPWWLTLFGWLYPLVMR